MAERGPTARVPRALRPAPRARPLAVRAPLLALAISALTTGCLDIVSLGEGPPETHDSADLFIPVEALPSTSGDTVLFPETGQCTPGPHTDLDGDGFTPEDGDCDDCDPSVGPDAIEIVTEEGDPPADENCDGQIDEPAPSCDDGLKQGDLSPYSAARALDLCQMSDGPRWGVHAAAWVLPDGSPAPLGPGFDLGHGILSDFGPHMPVRGGSRLLALSTGTARLPGDPEFADLRGFDKEYTSKPLDGLPGDTTICPAVGSGTPHDAVALELTLRAPQNAESFAFDFDFYSFEFPEDLCSSHDDLFAALLDPPAPGSATGNIAEDAAGNIVSVNSVRFEVCQCTAGPPCFFHGLEYGCSLGAKELAGTGFGVTLPTDIDHGATGWLVSEAEIAPGSTFRLRFLIQDAEDHTMDSTVLLDHFRFRGPGPKIPRSSHPTH